MLSSARKTNFSGEDGIFSSEAMGTFQQMQDERFADIASDTGAFGLARMIEAQLARYLPAGAAKSADTTAANKTMPDQAGQG
jgi:flagellar protein FlgJ